MFGFFRGNGVLTCNSQISNSQITTSTIDMNSGVITSHGAPVNGSDVVNKTYVDSLTTSGIPSVTVTLTNTAYSSVLSATSGMIILLIKNQVTNGPSAVFMIGKSESTQEPAFFKPIDKQGLTSGEHLELKWDTGTGVQMRKTGNNYNGNYDVKYILN